MWMPWLLQWIKAFTAKNQVNKLTDANHLTFIKAQTVTFGADFAYI